MPTRASKPPKKKPAKSEDEVQAARRILDHIIDQTEQEPPALSVEPAAGPRSSLLRN